MADVDESKPEPKPDKPTGRKLFQKGFDPRRNTTKAGPGRPADEFIAWCAGLLANPKSRKEVEAVLNDRKHPAFATMWAKVADRAHGKPVERQEISGPNGGALEVVYVTMTRASDAGS